MNIFRLAGDLAHVFAIFVLLLKMKTSRNCAGISLKTQELYFVVFCCRYVDLFMLNPFHTVLRFYNTIMKILFISSTAYTIYLMRKRYRHTYRETQDTFRIEFLLGPAAALAIIFHVKPTVFEILWAFSIFLEAVAILPQLFLLQKTGQVENITSHYIFALGLYRALYIVNWIVRFFMENDRQYIVWAAGLVQTGLYADFFYHYLISKTQGKKLKLPP